MKSCLAMESTSFIKFSLMSLISIIALMTEMHGYKACLETERTALLELKSFFVSVSDIGYDHEILRSWGGDDEGMSSDCCDDWEGVKCSATTRRVMQLSLNKTTKFNDSNYNLFYGGPSASLLNMSLFYPFEELQNLDLSGNRFEGLYENKTYDSFGSLKQLKILNLGDNRFNDSILRYLNTLTSLTTLILRFNNIEGSRTKQGLANLRFLQVLDLHWNKINSGSLTRLGLVNLTNLKTLDLSDCRITTLQGLPNLRCLRVLDLSWNSDLTSGFANLTNLKILDLSGCGITTLQGVCELKNLSEFILRGINIKGHLPDCLKNLSHLKVLDISYNQLSGTLPSAITTLTSLEYLALLDNNFEGTFLLNSLANHSKLEVLLLSSRTNMLSVKTENFLPTFQLKVLGLPNYNLKVIPSFLLHQYDLKLLDLSGNNLVGDFPTWVLRNNTKLEALFLTNNSFTGNLQLPKTKHDFLHHLDVSNNNLTGKLPEDMGIILQKLLYIDMSDNRFEGYLPSSIGEMKALIFLRLPKNNFSGELPAPLLTGCISLGLLDLSGNNFYGQIFPKYMNLTQLEFLYLENNKFSGKIEEGLSNSNELNELDISNNLLSGHIPHWIGNFSSDLKVLLMSKMFLKGNIPAQLLNHGSLNLLSVSENCLSGPMTSSFNLSSLEHLYLQMNSLSGPIPIALFRSSNLITLDLRDNRFSGVIPHQISESLTLRFLLLRGNYLEGQIPNQLCQLRRLGVLDLSHNRISGSIPSCLTIMLLWVAGNVYLHEPYLQFFSAIFVGSIGTYYNSTFHFGHYGNGVYSIFPQLVKVEFMTKNRYELYNGSNIKYMVGLDLSCNQLTGGIPSEIGDLQIRGLNLSYNFLSGSIPGSFSNLKWIESLDLSHNRLSGQVPPRLTELNFLSNFNVSFNNLSGLIPDKGQFATFDESSYRGNLHLCGPTINKSCNSTEEVPATTSIQGEVEDECAIDTVSLYWSFGASYVTVILGLFAILWINSNWRRQWFYFIDACIDLCYYWLYKYVFDR
ncbi:Receptor-like protein 14 [Citrus sinensis]|uniref:Receptor-like protein 14 n=1 Tax=Citrus sinensis TaxID=2711 RepID=A0ACB8HUK4_CITSI|nr:Receptor-like protein 14 [Citrus sinensis]